MAPKASSTEAISPTNFNRTWAWSLSPTTIQNGWQRYRYTMTENGVSRSWWVHVFRAWNIVPAVTRTNRRERVTSISPNPAWFPNNQITCRVNGNYFDNHGPVWFHGIYFTRFGDRTELAKDGVINPTDPAHLAANIGEGQGGWFRYSPSFCIAPNMTANIHWISHQGGNQRITLAQAQSRYNRIIPGMHCLVHNSRPVFDIRSYSWEGVTIADWSRTLNSDGLHNIWNHHNHRLGSENCRRYRRRTLLGHVRSNNSFLMVVVEGVDDWGDHTGSGMDLRTASRFMFDMGCDYAINLDGGTPSQMYTGNTRRYGGPVGHPVGSTVCAF